MFLKRKKGLTGQEKHAHPKLVEARNLVQETVGTSREMAALCCNHMTDREVNAVLEAEGDLEKTQKVVDKVQARIAELV